MREELIKLIQICEENKHLNLRITCDPVYNKEGEFVSFNFFLDNYKDYDQIGDSIYVVKSDFEEKGVSLSEIIDNSCKCDYPGIFSDDAANFECTCNKYTIEQAEEIHYTNILEEIKERLIIIKEKVK